MKKGMEGGVDENECERTGATNRAKDDKARSKKGRIVGIVFLLFVSCLPLFHHTFV